MTAQIAGSHAVVPFRHPSMADPWAGARRPRSETIALVHDWCPDFRGGERVLAELCKLGDTADIYTLFDFLSDATKARHFPNARFHTSVADRLPGVRRYYRALFFLCPFLIEQFDVTSYDIVVSSSAAFARGVITRPDQPHLCYVHSPVRYAWDEQFSYLEQAGLGFGPKGLLYRYMLHRLRTWDTRTANGPDVLLANSRYVRARIRRIYGRDARVVPPPVSLGELTYLPHKDDYYVTACYLAPYKRTDLVVKAFNAMPGRRLVVIGAGQQAKALAEMAGPNVKIVGYLPRDQFVAMVSRARALIFAGCEDFGITLAEAQACGTPVIALERGGAGDIVVPLGTGSPPTGVLFRSQTVDGVTRAIEDFEAHRGEIAPAACQANAARFSVENFHQRIHAAVDEALDLKRQQFLAGTDGG